MSTPAAGLFSRQSPLMLLGVFLIFAPVMVVSVTVPRGETPWPIVLGWFVLSGLAGLVWSMTGVRGVRWILLAVPLQLVLVALFSSASLRAFQVRQPGISVEGLGTVAALALGFACLARYVFTQGVAGLRLETELELAGRVHRHLVPPIEFEAGHIRVAGRSVACSEMGGDLVDAALLADGTVELIVADVSGHGVRAGVVMAMVKAVLHAHRSRHEERVGREPGSNRRADAGLDAVLAELNRTIVRLTEPGDFVTLAAVRVAPDGALTTALAGHPPILLRNADGGVEQIGDGGMPLGIVDDAEWIELEHPTRLTAGSSLVLYSDGLIEIPAPGAGSDPSTQLGVDGLAEIVGRMRDADPMETVDELLRSIATLAGSKEAAADDRTAAIVAVGARGHAA